MPPAHYDFAIVGSGLGGLQCAYILSDFGYRVCVLEQNQQLGGSLQVFARDRMVFDTGVHYVGAMDPGAALHRYFSYFGLTGSVRWKRMDAHGFDRIAFRGDATQYWHDQGWDAFVERLCGYFPEERAAIVAYREEMERVMANFPLDLLEDSDTDHRSADPFERSASDFIASLTEDRKLRAVLAGSSLLHAGPADKCPLFAHALTVGSYMHGAWRCVDGGSQLARQLAIGIRERGGEIVRRARVIGFHADGQRVTAAAVEDGREFVAERFISNLHPRTTFALLPETLRKGPYFKRIAEHPDGLSSFSTHIVCKPGCFPFLNHNIYLHRSEDVFARSDYREEEWPLNMLISTPATSRSDRWAEGITLMTYMRSSETAPWAASRNSIVRPGDRGEGYEAFKRHKAERMIAAAEEVLPGIRECIHSVHTTSPLTFRDYIGTPDGSMYGLEKDWRSPLRTLLPAKTKVPNLYLTGQNINLHGMMGVTVSSVVTCSAFVPRRELLARIRAASA